MKTKYAFLILLPSLFFLVFLAGCSKDKAEKMNSAALIERYDLAGNYKIQITPRMMGTTPVATGIHDAELIDEGNGVLRLYFTGFKTSPMPFVMSVNMRMKLHKGSGEEIVVENLGGDFDADLPGGQSAIDPDDAPPGIQLPEQALAEGFHSNGASEIEGKYKRIENGDGEQQMNFDWELHPNISLPVTVQIKTLYKLSP